MLVPSPAAGVQVEEHRLQADEYRLKAAFVYRFPQFVQWPAAALEGRQSIDVCIVRPDPFGAILLELLKGEAVNGRPLQARQLDADDSPDGCHVVVVAGAAARRGGGLVTRLSGRPVLTIGDDPSFLPNGGIIVMKIVDSRVRFEVSLTNARSSGLQINAQLLRLALAVHGGQP